MLRILIVDDVYENQLLLSKTLEKLNHKFEIVDSGYKALEITRKSQFDFIFMDISMPGMNGVETTKNIRKPDHPVKDQTPIVAVTAFYNRDDFMKRYAKEGFQDIVVKPYRTEEIEKIIKMYTDGKVA